MEEALLSIIGRARMHAQRTGRTIESTYVRTPGQNQSASSPGR